jgi:HSP20 family protein
MNALVRWEPFLGDIDTLAGRFKQMLTSSWPFHVDPMAGEPATMSWVPAVDIYDTGEALLLEAELPGYQKEDIDVRVENGTLYITGERKRPEAETGHQRSYVLSERAFGRFRRSFPLPTLIDSKGIAATLRDGVLTVTLPKTEASRPVDIRIH